MGRAGVRANEEPAHRVYVSAFEMATTPVTNAQYRRFLVATGDESPPFFGAPGFEAPDQPVVGVNFNQALRFCAWLSDETGLPLRLPTEAEREKASRGGIEGAVFPWGDDPGFGRTPDPSRPAPPSGARPLDASERVRLVPHGGHGARVVPRFLRPGLLFDFSRGQSLRVRRRAPLGPRRIVEARARRNPVRGAKLAPASLPLRGLRIPLGGIRPVIYSGHVGLQFSRVDRSLLPREDSRGRVPSLLRVPSSRASRSITPSVASRART